MPIYDFKCGDCGQVSEIFVRSIHSQNTSCPACGSGNMEKMISSPSLVRMGGAASGGTCCGRAERCETPPCSTGDGCRRH